MFRWILSGLQALLIVVLLPTLIPNGEGGTLQPWKRLLLDPVKAWKLDYYVDPYRILFQSGYRLVFGETEPVRVRVFESGDGSLHASNLPEAKGKPVVIEDRNSDLAPPTRFQGSVLMVFVWLLLLLFIQWNKLRLLPKQTPNRKGLAEFIPYKVHSRVQRPVRDITPAEDEDDPHTEQQADRALRSARSSTARIGKTLEHETDTERDLLR